MQIPRKLRNTLCTLLGTIALTSGCDSSKTLYNGKLGNDNVKYVQIPDGFGQISSQTLSIQKAENASLELIDDSPLPVDYKIDKVRIIGDKTTEYSASNATDSAIIQEGQRIFNEYKARIQEEKPKEDLEFLRNF